MRQVLFSAVLGLALVGFTGSAFAFGGCSGGSHETASDQQSTSVADSSSATKQSTPAPSQN